MTVTRKAFSGEKAAEERADPWKNDGDYGVGDSAQALMKTMTGAVASQGGLSSGLPAGSGPGDDATPPRKLYSAGEPGPGVIAGGTGSSTGAAGAVPPSVDKTGGPKQTGAGSGKKIVKTYGPGGIGGPPGSLTQGGGALGRNTAK